MTTTAVMTEETRTEASTTTMKPVPREEAIAEATKYFDGDAMAGTVWVNKYALKDADGNIYERTPDDMHRRIASEIARVESRYPNPMGAEEVYSLLKNFRYIVPQGSPMAGIGNNLQVVSLSNCFVVGVPEGMGDSYGAIMRIDEMQVQLMKRRCGVGFDLSEIRPAGSPVNNAAITSTGVVPYMERYSNSTREVAQDGRRGALMLTIGIGHPESEKFIDAKLDTTKVTGANVSVRIDDAFMRAAIAGETYVQRWPMHGEPRVTKEVDARALWSKITNNAWKSAEPGVLFWDRILRESPADCYADEGFRTLSTNPCGELPLCSGDSCRLLALNLYSYVRKPFTEGASFDWELFKKHVDRAQRMMDDIVDLELEKIDQILSKIASDPEGSDIKRVEREMWEEIKRKCSRGRRTGTGVTGEGDMLAALGLKYGTPSATDFAVLVHKTLALEAYRSSARMAQERGAFPMWDPAKEASNPFIARLCEADSELAKDLRTTGRRNVALLTIAPTGTVSIMTQTTSGIECAYSVAYMRRRKVNPNDKDAKPTFVDQVGDSWEEYQVFHHHFKTWLATNGYDANRVSKMPQAELASIIAASPYHGALSNDVDWVEKVRMQGAVQEWVDHSISVTVNVPSEVTPEMVNDIYTTAWRAGCKGCTIYRDGSRTGVLITQKEEAAARFSDTSAPKRPKSLECIVTRFTNGGERWIGFIGLLDGRPYELFTGNIENFPVPSYVESGHIVKEKREGRGGYHFVYEDKTGAEIRLPNLNHAFDPGYHDVAKILSAVLRHGMPLPYVAEMLDGLNLDGDLVNTWKSGVRRMLKRYIKDGTAVVGKTCHDCGSDALEYKEGCMTCSACGSSKCG